MLRSRAASLNAGAMENQNGRDRLLPLATGAPNQIEPSERLDWAETRASRSRWNVGYCADSDLSRSGPRKDAIRPRSSPCDT